MFKSKSIPMNWETGAMPYRTTGFYGHTPKFWSCKDRDFHQGWQKFEPSDGPFDDADEPEWHREFAENEERAHANCRWPYKHNSYSGYVAFVFPRKWKLSRLMFYYYGRAPRKRLEL